MKNWILQGGIEKKNLYWDSKADFSELEWEEHEQWKAQNKT